MDPERRTAGTMRGKTAWLTGILRVAPRFGQLTPRKPGCLYLPSWSMIIAALA